MTELHFAGFGSFFPPSLSPIIVVGLSLFVGWALSNCIVSREKVFVLLMIFYVLCSCNVDTPHGPLTTPVYYPQSRTDYKSVAVAQPLTSTTDANVYLHQSILMSPPQPVSISIISEHHESVFFFISSYPTCEVESSAVGSLNYESRI
jgi:hypothetical protein